VPRAKQRYEGRWVKRKSSTDISGKYVENTKVK
jgi:hypothetical protein